MSGLMRTRHSVLSLPEKAVLAAAALLVLAAVAAALVAEDLGGLARGLGSGGLALAAATAASLGLRRYRAGLTAALPTSVARVEVRVRPARGFNAATVALAVVLPAGAALALLVLVEWAWLPLAGLVLLGCVAALVAREEDGRTYEWTSDLASGLLERLCMRADMRAREVVVEHGPPGAWTAGGRIHVTKRLLELLDEAELEAVLAHEVAHLARRDAPVMEICSAPSHVLLAFTRVIVPWTYKVLREGMLRTTGAMIALGVLCGPPALVIGWVSRLSVLAMSRAREFSADAAAVTLTGRPSALASALMKLDDQRNWTPRSDLRQLDAVLCIVGTGRRRLGRLFSTHPPIAARVKRLEETEVRIQARSHPARV